MKLLKLSLAASLVLVFLAVSSTPADARMSIRIRRNGSDTTSKVKIRERIENLFKQDNDTDVDNDVDGEVDTGENEAEDNTTADVDLKSGSLDLDLNIKTEGDYNDLMVDTCCEGEENSIGDVIITDNGSDSENKVVVKMTEELELKQENESDVDNDVTLDVDTGDNEAKDNTNGSIKIRSGDVKVKIKIRNGGNINIADVNTCCEVGEDYINL